MKVVVGLEFMKEAFNTCALYAFLKDLETGESQTITLATDSWTNREPETLSDKARLIEDIVKLNKEECLGYHRCLAWVKGKAFNSFEEAEKFARNLYRQAERMYKKKELRRLEQEVLKSRFYMYTAVLNPEFSQDVLSALYDALPDDANTECPAFFPLHEVARIVQEKGNSEDKELLKEMEELGVDYVEIRF